MMDRVQRAHIFSAFDALKGFREMLKEKERVVVEKRILSEEDLKVLDRKVHALQKGMTVTVIYYENGDYIKQTGRISKISLDEMILQVVKKVIDLKNIVDIQAKELEIYEL